jgi:hypothetical protein
LEKRTWNLSEVQYQIPADPRLGDGRDLNAPVDDPNLQNDDASQPSAQPQQADPSAGQQQDANAQPEAMNDAAYLQQPQEDPQLIQSQQDSIGTEVELDRQKKLRVFGLIDSLKDHADRIEEALNKTETDRFEDENVDKSSLSEAIKNLDLIKDKIDAYKSGAFVDDPYERNLYVYGLLRVELINTIKQIRAILKLDEIGDE